MIRKITEVLIATLIVAYVFYFFGNLVIEKRNHCRAVNSEYSDYRFCLGI